MKILVATRETQNPEQNDYCFCEEGEVVVPNVLADYKCFLGIKTRLSTTTVKVIEETGFTASFDTLLDAVMLSEVEAGLCSDPHDPEHRLEWIDVLEKCLDTVAEFPVGTILVVALQNEKGVLPRFIPEGNA